MLHFFVIPLLGRNFGKKKHSRRSVNDCSFVRSVPWYSTIRGDTPIHRGESRTRREVDMPRAREEGAVYLAEGSESKLHVKMIYLRVLVNI